MLSVYLACQILLATAALFLTRVHREGEGYRWELTPSFLLVLTYCLYAIALPVSRLFFGSDPHSADFSYLLPHLLGMVGLVVGLALLHGKARLPGGRGDTQGEPDRVLRVSWVVVAVVAAVSWQLYGGWLQAGGSLAGLLAPYAYGASEFDTPTGLVGVLTTTSANIAIASLVLSVPGLKTHRRFAYFVFGASVVVALLFVLRGNRNLLGMLVLPMVYIHLYRRRIRVRRVLLYILGAYVFIYGVGIIRNSGFAQLGRGIEALASGEAFDPIGGELGTSFSVYSKWRGIQGPSQQPVWGATYTTGVLTNLVPRSLWPDRPPTPAVQLSMDYYRTRDLKLGLGFSPTVEALINFGTWGVIPIFALLAAAVRGVELWAYRFGPVGQAVNGFLLPFVVNWNRIDMATNIKMFLVFVSVTVILRIVYYRKVPLPQPAPASGLPPVPHGRIWSPGVVPPAGLGEGRAG